MIIQLASYALFVAILFARGGNRFALYVISQILFPVNMTAILHPVNIYSNVLFGVGYFLSVFFEIGVGTEYLKFRLAKPVILFGIVGFFVCLVDQRLPLFNKIARPVMHWFNFCAILPLLIRDANSIRNLRRVGVVGFVCLAASLAYALVCKIVGANFYHMKISEFSPAPDIANIYMNANERFRVSGFFAHPMDFALFGAYATALSFQLYERKTLSLLMAGLFAAMSGYAVMLGNSRLPMLIWLIVVGCVFMFSRVVPWLRSIKLVVVIVILGVGLATTSTSDDDLVGQTLRIFNDEHAVQGSSIEMRIGQLQASVGVAASKPILGHGLSYIIENMDFHLNEDGNAEGVEEDFAGFESIIFSVPIEQGFVGLFAYLFLYWCIYVEAMRAQNRATWNYAALILVLFVFYQIGTGMLGSAPLSFAFLAIMMRISRSEVEHGQGGRKEVIA